MDAPEKVKRVALEAGAHDDCIDAGPARACFRCAELMDAAFDYFYGDLPPDRVRLAIAADLYGGR